ncbi:MAG: hypothetical protein KKE30_04605 [Gammaproteobacteria bacterium]|nr:hypothetical protein [Gammaproteobacteria bacterium]
MEPMLDKIDEKQYQLQVIPDLNIHSQVTYERVIQFRNIAVEKKKLIEETFNPIVDRCNQAHKQAVQTRGKFLDPIKAIIARIDCNVRVYKANIERKALEEQQHLRKQAEEKAAKEREKLEKKAEKAMSTGDEVKALDLLAKAEEVEVMVPSAAPLFEKANGDTTRRIWRAEVVDFKALPDEYKLPDMKTLNAIARAKRGALSIPGVKWVCE